MASPLFRAMTPPERGQVLAHAVLRRFGRNAAILRRGDAGTGMFVILGGRARVSLVSADGRDVTLGVLGPGQLIGELSLLDGEPRSANVDALEDCQLLSIDRSRFLQLLRANPDLCIRLMGVLAGRLRQANQAIEELAALDLTGRLSQLLLRFLRDFGVKAAQGTRIDLRLSQKDLSALVAASREKVNQQLRSWVKDGTIAYERGYIVVLQPDALGPGPE